AETPARPADPADLLKSTSPATEKGSRLVPGQREARSQNRGMDRREAHPPFGVLRRPFFGIPRCRSKAVQAWRGGRESNPADTRDHSGRASPRMEMDQSPEQSPVCRSKGLRPPTYSDLRRTQSA